MIVLVILAIVVMIASLRGGRIANFATLNLRWRGLMIMSFLIQLLIFQPYWESVPETKSLTPLVYLVSLGLLLITLPANFHIPGIRLLTLGFALNCLAIFFNGGYMPSSEAARALAGMRPLLPSQTYNNSIGMGPETRLAFLGDVLAIPKGFPFPNVFSIGDVLIALGGIYLVWRVMTTPSVPPRSNL